ncbi:hypothetical protein Nepgr_033494 [Nepenthes gracilis]|uniref:Uncharacterized protein n=1 Tax=Nepenthes gracilis TaxID=150966 RepID=A0AAD3Y8F2_NEPGR|nr:hypothetical protein Nepgr_033494 [Nepenthes gracilis]
MFLARDSSSSILSNYRKPEKTACEVLGSYRKNQQQEHRLLGFCLEDFVRHRTTLQVLIWYSLSELDLGFDSTVLRNQNLDSCAAEIKSISQPNPELILQHNSCLFLVFLVTFLIMLVATKRKTGSVD